jgi:hypothetical protein
MADAKSAEFKIRCESCEMWSARNKLPIGENNKTRPFSSHLFPTE